MLEASYFEGITLPGIGAVRTGEAELPDTGERVPALYRDRGGRQSPVLLDVSDDVSAFFRDLPPPSSGLGYVEALLPEVAPGVNPAKPKRRRRKRSEGSAVVPFPEEVRSDQIRKAEGR